MTIFTVHSQAQERGCSAPGFGRVAATLAICGEILLGAVFSYAAITKLVGPEAAIRLVEHGLGTSQVTAKHAVHVVGWLELLVGVWLLAGVFSRAALTAVTVMLLCFCVVLWIGLHNGFHGACGCLGFRDSVPMALFKNSLLLALVGFIAAFRHSVARIDAPIP